MINLYMKRQVYAFIDSQNLNLGIRDQGWRLDFRKFRVYLKDKYKVNKSFLFIGYIAENEKLYDALRSFGYKIVFKPTVKHKGETKGNIDAELVLWSANVEYQKYSKAVIITGDGDFYCLVKFLIKKKKLRKVLIPNRKKFSSLLWEFKEYLEFANNLKDKLAYWK